MDDGGPVPAAAATVPPLAVCLAGERVIVRCATPADAEALADLLRNDEALRNPGGTREPGPASGADLLQTTDRWARQHAAVCLAIVARDAGRAVGMISLSHVDRIARTGRVGYWIGSAHRRRGLTGQAFGLVLDLARSLGLESVSGTIGTDNVASQRIYLRYGAVASPAQGGRATYTVCLGAGRPGEG